MSSILPPGREPVRVSSHPGRPISRLGHEAISLFRAKLAGGFAARAFDEKLIAVIVPARNERDGIARTLDGLMASIALAERGGDRFIVEVVVNGRDDGTARLVRDRIERRPFPGQAVVSVRESQAGKVPALLEPKRRLEALAASPAFVLQLDADTHLSPGDVTYLLEAARATGATATGARSTLELPEGESLDKGVAAFGAIMERESSWLIQGNLVLSRTVAFFAGYETILEKLPGSCTEDGMYCALLRHTQQRVERDLRVQSSQRAVSDRAALERQVARWMMGGVQLELIFGSPPQDQPRTLPPELMMTALKALENMIPVNRPFDWVPARDAAAPERTSADDRWEDPPSETRT